MPFYEDIPIGSAYQKSATYGQKLYDFVRKLNPTRVIEFGCGNGYTTCIISNALSFEARFTSYDTFAHRYGWPLQKLRVHWNVNRYGNPHITKLIRKDFWQWVLHPEPCDLLYVDIGNTGHVIKHIETLPNVKAVLFEGGIPERDKVYWMPGKPTICGSGVPYTVIDKNFPGLSVLKPIDAH